MNLVNLKQFEKNIFCALVSGALLFYCNANLAFGDTGSIDNTITANTTNPDNELKGEVQVDKEAAPDLEREHPQRAFGTQADGVYLWAKVGFLEGTYREEFSPIVVNKDHPIMGAEYQKLKADDQYVICANQWRSWYENIFQTISEKVGNKTPKGGCIWLDITVDQNKKVSAFVNSATPANDQALLAYADNLVRAIRGLDSKPSIKLPACCKLPLVQVKFLARDSDHTFLLENSSPTLLNL